MAKGNGKKAKVAKTPQGITHITVGGYKSIAREQTIEIRPLTVLAGANSSGKSSIMQPLLLLKQTLEAPYDPGALLLNGPNVKFTSVDQMLTKCGKLDENGKIVVAINITADGKLRLEFARDKTRRLEVVRMKSYMAGDPLEITPTSWPDEWNEPYRELESAFRTHDKDIKFEIKVERNRCFLDLIMIGNSPKWETPREYEKQPASVHFMMHARHIHEVIHVPGNRGNPERAYPVTAIGASFPGKFEAYVASIIAHWTSGGHGEKSDQLNEDSKNLGLTWKVEAKPIDDTQVEIRVGRLRQSSRGGAQDLVNIADVGSGISQTLPVLVALLAAEPGQLVYLEQPEIHLHPRAQVAMAQILANAANRGVRVVVETHSSLLLLAIQTAVAEGQLTPDKVILHWFARNDQGSTDIQSAELDEAGRAGDWPEDFADVSLEAQMHYLKAAGKHQVAQ